MLFDDERNDGEDTNAHLQELSRFFAETSKANATPDPELDEFEAELDAIASDDAEPGQATAVEPELVAEVVDEIDASVSDETPVAEAETVATPTDEIPTDLAPGCFGSALSYRADAAECLQCIFAPRCQPIHVESVPLLTAALATHPDTLRRRAIHEEKKVADKERIAARRAQVRATTSTSTSTPASPADPLDDLKEGYRARLDALRIATAGPSLSHSLRKLKGREADLAIWWVARQMARSKFGPKASATQAAACRTRMSRGAQEFTKKQAENALARIIGLEAPGSVWCGIVAHGRSLSGAEV